MRAGTSWHIEVDENSPTCIPLLMAIGAELQVMGSINVQLMMGEDGPVPFEINARLSGTTAVRAHFGFNEPEMTLRIFLLGEKLPPPEIRRGVVLRYVEEVFIDGAMAGNLAPPLPRGTVHPWF